MKRVAALIVLAGLCACHEDSTPGRPAPSASASPVIAPIRGAHPTPEAVCDHLFALATAAEGARGASAALGAPEACIQYEKRQSALSETSSCRNDVCSMHATTWSEAKRCATLSAEDQDPTGTCDRR